MKAGHTPVLAEEVIEMLQPAPGSLQIDATLGGGGHTERILEASDPDGRLLGLDADGAAVARVADRLGSRFGDRLVLRQANFRDLATVAPEAGFGAVDGALFDLGPLELPARRRGPRVRLPDRRSARHALRHQPRDPRGRTPRDARRRRADRPLPALRRGAEGRSRSPGPIVDARKTAPVRTAEELAALIEHVAPPNPRQPRRTHPATRVFQALRIAVNEELEALEAGLAAAVDLLRPGGRLVVLSYHSLEDRIVKRFFAAERRGCICPPHVPVCVCGHEPRLRLVTRPSLTPSAAEVAANPRARSARLRAAERLAA